MLQREKAAKEARAKCLCVSPGASGGAKGKSEAKRGEASDRRGARQRERARRSEAAEKQREREREVRMVTECT